MTAKPCPVCTPYGCPDCVADDQCDKCGLRLCNACREGDHGLGPHLCIKPKKRWCNVTASIEVIIEVPEGTLPEPAAIKESIEAGHWYHISLPRVVSVREDLE